MVWPSGVVICPALETEVPSNSTEPPWAVAVAGADAVIDAPAATVTAPPAFDRLGVVAPLPRTNPLASVSASAGAVAVYWLFPAAGA